MKRIYSVSASIAPDLPQPSALSVAGSFAFGPFNAAQAYADKMLPGYEAIPGGRVERPNLYRFEAINHAQQLGAVIWVRSGVDFGNTVSV